MLKRTLIVMTLTFALATTALPLQSVHSVLMTETELAILEAKDASARELSSATAYATDYDTNQTRGGNGFVRALKAPFKALGRLFGGGKKKEGRFERISEKDIRNFESTPADPIKAAAVVKPTKVEKLSDNSDNRAPEHL